MSDYPDTWIQWACRNISNRLSAERIDVVQCLAPDRLAPLAADPARLTLQTATALVASSIAIQLDAHHVDAVTDAHAGEDHGFLPRPPFPVTWFELTADGQPWLFASPGTAWPDDPEDGVDLGIVVIELDPGRKWHVWVLGGKGVYGRIDGWGVIPIILDTDGAQLQYTIPSGIREGATEDEARETFGQLVSFAQACCELSTARGARLTDPFPSRQTRRAYERAYRFTPPTLYRLKIGGPVKHHPEGPGMREYHCQWLVRGHWRDLGGRMTWVRPYIKGPEGAPFKGRPMYHVTPDA